MCDMLYAKIDCLARKIEHLKIGYSCVHESGLPDFGRSKVALWEAGSPQHFLCVRTETGKKQIFK